MTYSQVLSGLDKDAAHSSVQAQADSTLPSTDPLGAKHYYVPFAEAKTLGFISSTGTEVDGYIGMSNAASLDFAQPTAAGYFDAVGALEHEISAVMGRVDAVGSVYGAGIYHRRFLISSAIARPPAFARLRPAPPLPISRSMTVASQIWGTTRRRRTLPIGITV